jgi:hypothetical protein
MPGPGSVTYWITQLKAGDPAAAQALWEGYFRRMVARARQKLADAPRRAADEEDVALSAFTSFYRAAEQGRFPRLDDRHDLWQLLMLLTDRKAGHLLESERSQRRGGSVGSGSCGRGRTACGTSRSPSSYGRRPRTGTAPTAATVEKDFSPTRPQWPRQRIRR